MATPMTRAITELDSPLPIGPVEDVPKLSEDQFLQMKAKRRRRCGGRSFGLDRFCTCGIRPGTLPIAQDENQNPLTVVAADAIPEIEDKDYFGKYAYFDKWAYDLNLPQELIGQTYMDAHCHLDFLLQNIRYGSVGWTYKTELCSFWLEGTCGYDDCGFAHGDSEILPRYPLVEEDLRSFARRHFRNSHVEVDHADEVCSEMSPPTLRYLVTSSCDLSSIEDCVFLSKATTRYLGGTVYVTFGCHPHTYREYNADAERQLLDALEACGDRAVGIGECGLDYFKNYHDAKDPIAHAKMIEVFSQQAKLAVDRGLPLVVHSRDAEEDTLHVLRQLPREQKVHVHAFQGSVHMMDEVLSMLPNSVFGVSALLAKPTAFPEVIDIARNCPLDRMVLESDAPFLCGEPREVPRVAVKVAELKGVSITEVLTVTNRNCECFYNLRASVANHAMDGQSLQKHV